ncbi:MAG: type I-MYXAN CRISPR-associated Cas8a1/Cmx1 [Leptolyngbya sp. UWPOB_LEPTO1]|uniref:type I-MYXAN CRISPR-associated Cas8a1/Cmx1 n=1 Tax=Leptolyngbya sp. UWPOB_LEPTO1 TaxID=2815653 RepID=UPI001AC091DC|nr:type I-MYXAN CRISPR-associated Cas8a1/Cmx1 [Leptolyngbya sp. UWPOB_LEPTO1]MBN8564102.1 type I-MYXAN CRISPR-associated Cas8a1/Cmx1 [Leptolyngbya sp. UWPOB_LEPTO1]
MTEFTLSIFNPNTLLPHRAGIAGLALALLVLPKDAPLDWEVTDDAVKLTWQSSDYEAVKWLLDQTYRITPNGYLEVPALKLDEQGKYTFTQGVLSTFLQHSKQRKLDVPVTRSFTIDEGHPEIRIEVRPLLNCYYTEDIKEAFNSKGAFKKEISLKGHHLPGLVECFANGAYQESPEGFLALLFLPISCGYYKLPAQSIGGKLAARSAVVIPNVTHLRHWVRSRQNLSGRTYRDFRSSGAGESALHFLLQEKTLEDAQQFRVDYCEVYQLGKQVWDANQSYLKQAVYRVQVNDAVLKLYEVVRQLFPAQVKHTDKGETWLAISKILPWICDNLVATEPWYQGFFEFRKRNGVYEHRGLVKMTEYLKAEEQVLFDAVQGAFSKYLSGQHKQAEKQGRKLDYGQVTDKVIYRMQRPSTQREFATALVNFLSQFRSKAGRSVGPQIYHWIHREANWRQARDLTLLAIATYTSKKGDALDGIDVSIESSAETDSTDDAMFSSTV